MFTLQELKYLQHVMEVTSTYTIAKGEQLDYPGVKHKQLQNKIYSKITRLTI